MLDDPDILSDLDQLGSRYHVLRHLGYDGGCAVHAVRGRDSDRHYVVKVMPKPGAGSVQTGTLHLWQAQAIERLDHPKLIVLHAVHHLQGGTLALAMERRRGRTVAERVAAEGPLPVAEVESTLRDVAAALAYLHARGIVHRGVNSDSILFDRDSGCARLAHFGISHGERAGEVARDDGASLRRALAYESPEQGSDPGPRSDLYSLALVGYAMLTGREPWVGDDATSGHVPEPPPPLETLRPDAPPHLCRAIEACLVRAPRQRCRSVEEFLARLDPHAEHAPVAQRADLAGLRARVGPAVAAIRTAVAERSDFTRPPILALVLPAALVTLVAWTLLRADDVPPPVQPLPGVTAGASPQRVAVETPAVDTDLPNPPSGAGRARSSELEGQPASEPDASSPRAPVLRRARQESRAVTRSPSRSPAVLGVPVDRPAPPRLLGEELASARRRR
jgi:hypothetical protein